ncbi:unnamed protein product, partial [Owenia fusiformis]
LPPVLAKKPNSSRINKTFLRIVDDLDNVKIDAESIDTDGASNELHENGNASVVVADGAPTEQNATSNTAHVHIVYNSNNDPMAYDAMEDDYSDVDTDGTDDDDNPNTGLLTVNTEESSTNRKISYSYKKVYDSLKPQDLREILDSASSLNTVNTQEEPKKPFDIDESDDTDLEEEERPSKMPSQVDIYNTACKKFGIVPSSNLLKQLQLDRAILDMTNRSIGPLGTRALCIPLLSNTKVKVLRLQGCDVGESGARAVADMLKENVIITDVDLSENNIGSKGAEYICEMLMDNAGINSLNLAGNNFQERDAEKFAAAITKTFRLQELDLSHNDFREAGGILLGQAIADNTTLEILNLSWNHLRLKGGRAIAKGIAFNDSIQVLDLSWNGISNDGAKAMGTALKRNTTLVELDLSCNRISLEGIVSFCTGLRLNTTLQILKISKNPLTTMGACLILEMLKKSKKSALARLEISAVDITDEFYQLLDEVQAKRPHFHVIHGGYVRHNDAFAERLIREGTMKDPLVLLMRFIRQNNYRMIDFFSHFDGDKNWNVTTDEFRKGIRSIGLPLNHLQIEELIKHFDYNNNGEIDFRELMQTHRNYRHKVRRKMKRQKQRSRVTTPIQDLPGMVNELTTTRPPGGEKTLVRPFSQTSSTMPSLYTPRPKSSTFQRQTINSPATFDRLSSGISTPDSRSTRSTTPGFRPHSGRSYGGRPLSGRPLNDRRGSLPLSATIQSFGADAKDIKKASKSALINFQANSSIDTLNTLSVDSQSSLTLPPLGR